MLTERSEFLNEDILLKQFIRFVNGFMQLRYFTEQGELMLCWMKREDVARRVICRVSSLSAAGLSIPDFNQN